ncbi:MAG: hypothetical protein KTR15_04090 [Phycisphaeraceae bacterium]|nr:hypothetical protein [Phycisphaeraceae bacterium]
MAAYFSGVIGRAGSNRLADWINESEANACAFARFAIEHHALEHLLRVEKYGDLASLSQHEFLAADAANQGLTQRTELQWLSEMEDSVPVVPVVLQEQAKGLRANGCASSSGINSAAEQDASGRKRVIVIPRPLFWGGVAALLLIGFWMSWQFSPQAGGPIGGRGVAPDATPAPAPPPVVVATLEGQSDPAWADGESRAIGAQLIEGEYLLSQGTVRLRFSNGALVVVESPARFSLHSASMITLEEGQLVSHCDPEAQGFCVRTPYGDFIDLGTKFGVSVRPWKESQLHVFQGEVKTVVHRLDSGEAESRIVHTSEAVAIGPIHGQAIQPLANANPELFDTARRRVVASRNTGASMGEGLRDRQWLVVKLNQRVLDPPLPAVLFVPPTKEQLKHGPVSKLPEPIFLPNRPDQLCWIKPDPSLVSQDVETTAYTTSFDLEGYDASSARLDLGFNADNSVSAIRLNGQPIPVPDAPNAPNVSPYAQLNRVKIQEGFLPGRNQIEIVVTNAKPKARPTYTGLVAELSITAQPDWIAAPKERRLPN